MNKLRIYLSIIGIILLAMSGVMDELNPVINSIWLLLLGVVCLVPTITSFLFKLSKEFKEAYEN